MPIRIIGNKELKKLTKTEKDILVDVSYKSKIWTRRLSPEVLGPVSLYSSYTAKTVENGFQYTKVFEEHIGVLKLPTKDYLNWALKGWSTIKPDRKLQKRNPLFYLWYGEKLNEFEAREYIFIPLYIQAVMREDSFFERLKRLYYKSDKNLVLYDMKGYDDNLSYKEAIQDKRPFSHAFILKMLLETTI